MPRSSVPSSTAESASDSGTPDIAPRRRSRWIAAALALGLAAYLIALVATLPARLIADAAGVPPAIAGISGTVWNGEASLPDGHIVTWSVSPLGSLVRFAVAADWTLTGPGTDLSGDAVAGTANLTLSDVRGLASWRLARAVAPAIVADCGLAARIDIETIDLGAGAQSASGGLRTGPATCNFDEAAGRRSVEVPALQATADGGSTIRLAEAADPSRVWAEIGLLPDRRLSVTWFEPAMKLVAGIQASGPVMLEFGF